ncbi:MAG: polyprenyl synthetase family protein [Candidatus Hodarchaeales archaeon]
MTKEQNRYYKEDFFKRFINEDLKNDYTIRLEQTIDNLPYPLNERIKKFIAFNSFKMTHFMLVVQSAKLLGATGKKLELAKNNGIIMELLDIMTIIHSDLLEGIPLHWGYPSYHKCYGLEKAIHDGDVLREFALSQVDTDYLKFVLNIAYQVSFGSLYKQELKQDNDFSFSQDHIIDILQHETAFLFSGCIGISCLITDRHELRKKIDDILVKVGIAFQIQNDIVDIANSKEKLSKETYWRIQASKRDLFLYNALLEKESEKIKEIYRKKTGKKTIDDIEFVLQSFHKPAVYNKIIQLKYGYLNNSLTDLDELIREGEGKEKDLFKYLKNLIFYLFI